MGCNKLYCERRRNDCATLYEPLLIMIGKHTHQNRRIFHIWSCITIAFFLCHLFFLMSKQYLLSFTQTNTLIPYSVKIVEQSCICKRKRLKWFKGTFKETLKQEGCLKRLYNKTYNLFTAQFFIIKINKWIL